MAASPQESQGTTYNFKVVLLGEGCVGKTSLLLRYIEDKFNDKHMTTLQATFLNKKMNFNGHRVHLSIWDTAGQEKFHALGPIYYRNSNGAILVYDITDMDSFLKVKNWVKELKKMLGSDICLVIAGNKIDLEQDSALEFEEAESYAQLVGAKHFHTSAKLDQGVDELFMELTSSMIEKFNQNHQKEENKSSRVLIVDDENAPQSSCCLGVKNNN